MPEKKTRKRMTGEERKSQIVTVAMQLFAKKGFKGTTTREIARKAGISEAVIFKHFSRKEDLYRAIIDARCSDSQGRHSLINSVKDKKGKEVFTEVANYLIIQNQKDSSFLRLFTYSALEQHDLSEMFIKTKGLELFEFLEGHIKELMENGEIRKVDPAIAARAFMGMVLHYNVSQELYGFKKYFDRPNKQVIDTFVEIFFDGIRRK